MGLTIGLWILAIMFGYLGIAAKLADDEARKQEKEKQQKPLTHSE